MPPAASVERAQTLSNLSMYWQQERHKRRTRLSVLLARSASSRPPPPSSKRRGGPDEEASLRIQIEFCSIALDYIQKCFGQGIFNGDGDGHHDRRAETVINTLVSMQSMLETSWGVPHPPLRRAAATVGSSGSGGSCGSSSGGGVLLSPS